MLHRLQSGGWVGLLLTLALGTTAPALSASPPKEKTVHLTGIVKTVTPTSISIEERHLLMRRVHTYTLSPSPNVESTTGTAPTSVTSIPVRAKVELTGTEGPDRKVTITEIKVLRLPKKGGPKK